MSEQLKEEQLHGTWRLVEWTAIVDGRSVQPFGGDTTGLITYTPDGRMWATLMKVDRKAVDAPTLAAASVSERAITAAGYLNYAGSYRVEPDQVIHSVEVSLYPNWIGGEQVRKVEWMPNPIGGSDLILSADDRHPKGTEVFNTLRWRRLEEWEDGSPMP